MHIRTLHMVTVTRVFFPHSSMKAFTQTRGAQTKFLTAQRYLTVPQPTPTLAN